MKQSSSIIDLKSISCDPLIKRKIENKKLRENISMKGNKFVLSISNNTSLSNKKSTEKNFFVKKLNRSNFKSADFST